MTAALRCLLLALLVLAPWVASADTKMSCLNQPNFVCATDADTVTGPLTLLGATPLVLDGLTDDTIEINVSVTDPTASDKTFTIPNADSVAVVAFDCAAGNHADSLNVTTGVVTCTADTGGTIAWNAITDPTGVLALTMDATETTAWTISGNTGAADMFSIKDATGNTGTGHLFEVHTVGTSTAKPLAVTVGGTANGIEMGNAGVLAKIGTGSIQADALVCTDCVDSSDIAAGTITGADISDTAFLVWNESCTTDTCTIAQLPRSADTALVVQHGITLRRVATCAGQGTNEYTLDAGTKILDFCDTTQGIGAAPDNALVTYERS